MFSQCGELVGHFPGVKWPKVTVAFIKRRAGVVTESWEKVNNVPLTVMMEKMIPRVHQEDPVQGKWCVDGPELNVWIDASSLASRISLEDDGTAMRVG